MRRRRTGGARGGLRASPGAAAPKEEAKSYYNISSPNKKQKPSKRIPAEKSNGGGGNLFQRLGLGRRKKAAPPSSRPAPVVVPRPLMTPVTLDSSSDEGAIELALPLPCERVASYAETAATHASSEYYARPSAISKQRPAAAATPMPRASSARVATTSSSLLVDTVPLAATRSARTFGNESLGDAQPDAPRRGGGYLPPLLGGNEEDDASTCSGITMDFTYDNSTPMRQASSLQLPSYTDGVPNLPAVRAATMMRGGAYEAPQARPQAFIPSYITMDQRDEVAMLPYY